MNNYELITVLVLRLPPTDIGIRAQAICLFPDTNLSFSRVMIDILVTFQLINKTLKPNEKELKRTRVIKIESYSKG